MAISFTLIARAPVSATEAWERLLDLRRHTQAIVWTRITPDESPMHTGLRFVARTQLGPLGFDDIMEVRTADGPAKRKPGHLVIDKETLGLAGTVEVTVEQLATGVRVIWRQRLDGGGITALLHPLASVVVGGGYALALRRILGRGTRIKATHRSFAPVGLDPHVVEVFPEAEEDPLH